MNRRTFLGLCAGAIASAAFPSILIPANGGRITPVRPRLAVPLSVNPQNDVLDELIKQFQEVGKRYIFQPNIEAVRNQLQAELSSVATEFQFRNQVSHFAIEPNYQSADTTFTPMNFTARIVPMRSLEYINIDLKI
jgi:hypothetical protein